MLSSVQYGAASLLLSSLYLYRKKVYRYDKNALNLSLFTGASAWTSYKTSSFLFNNTVTNKSESQYSIFGKP